VPSCFTVAAQATGLIFGFAASFVLSFEAFSTLQRLSMKIPFISRLYEGYFALGREERATRERLVIPYLYPGTIRPESPPIEYDVWRLGKGDLGFHEMLLVLLGAVEYLRTIGLVTPELPHADELLHVRRPEGITISTTLFRDEGIFIVSQTDSGQPEYLPLRYNYETLGTMVQQKEKSYLTRLGLILLSMSVLLQAFALFA
jgi:hypothetical protein